MEPNSVQEIRYCSECGQPTPADELARFGEHMVCPNCKNSYAQKLREGVSPNLAAAGGFRYAGFWIRFLAYIIDAIILGVMNSVVNMIFFGSLMTAMREQAANPAEMLSFMGTMGLVSLAGMAVGCCYEALFIAKMGATPGKMALSLKVVRGNGGPVDLGRAFGRYFAKILSGIILLIGYIMAGFDSQKRALHDMICDTRVIKREN